MARNVRTCGPTSCRAPPEEARGTQGIRKAVKWRQRARARRSRVPEDEARELFRQLMSAVDYCHSQGVVHRDIKPENILLTSDTQVKARETRAIPAPRRIGVSDTPKGRHAWCGR